MIHVIKGNGLLNNLKQAKSFISRFVKIIDAAGTSSMGVILKPAFKRALLLAISCRADYILLPGDEVQLC